MLAPSLVSAGQVLEVRVAAGGAVGAHAAVRRGAAVPLQPQVGAQLAVGGVGYVVKEGLENEANSSKKDLPNLGKLMREIGFGRESRDKQSHSLPIIKGSSINPNFPYRMRFC